jgi:hypothetical protein
MLQRFDDALMALGLAAVMLLGPLSVTAGAHTPESHPHLVQAQRDWFNSAKNRRGSLCCDNNDGNRAENWKMEGDKYHVFIEGSWYEVPDFALVSGNPNADAIVWYFRDSAGGILIRCFSPGPVT